MAGCAVVALFLSCASGPETGERPVYLTDSAAFRLLPPSCIEKPLDMAQQISGTYNSRTYKAKQFIMDAYVIADSARISMILFSAMGGEIADLSFDKENLQFKSDYFPKNLKAEYIVADFQLVFYDAGRLAEELESAGLRLVTRRDGGMKKTEKREVLNDGTVIIEIVKTSSEVRYTNHVRGYQYTLRGDFS
jgi:hypothetical protein